MKSEDLQKLVLHLAKEGKSVRNISDHLRGQVSKSTVQRWLKTYNTQGELVLSKPNGAKRTVRTKKAIENVKKQLKLKKSQKSTRFISKKLNISRTSVHRILKDDLNLKPFVVRKTTALTDIHKKKRVAFANWVRKNIRKSDSRRILFSDEKRFTVNGVYNRQNHRIWAPTRSIADSMKTHLKRKFPKSVMVWMGACYEGVTKIFIATETITSSYYINEILTIAKSEGVRMLGESNWTFQQDGASSHTATETQNWCLNNFPCYIDKSKWPPNSPDLNPMDYSIWIELCTHMNWNKITNTNMQQVKF